MRTCPKGRKRRKGEIRVLRKFMGNLPECSEVRCSNNNEELKHKGRERRVSKERGRKILGTQQ
jgi:hypothetical protein